MRVMRNSTAVQCDYCGKEAEFRGGFKMSPMIALFWPGKFQFKEYEGTKTGKGQDSYRDFCDLDCLEKFLQSMRE
jgi:hypothetical protein